MFAIEFQTKILDGIIEVPEAYRDRMRGPVRVILLADEGPAAPDLIDQLLSHPVAVPGFVPMQRDQVHERS
jgi:hypothetical protein